MLTAACAAFIILKETFIRLPESNYLEKKLFTLNHPDAGLQ